MKISPELGFAILFGTVLAALGVAVVCVTPWFPRAAGTSASHGPHVVESPDAGAEVALADGARNPLMATLPMLTARLIRTIIPP